MSVMFDRISWLCDKHNIKVSQLESLLRFSERSIAKWETNGDNAWISRVQAVANYFDVSLDFLTGNTDNPKSHKTTGIFAIRDSGFINSLNQLSTSAKEVVTFLDTYVPQVEDEYQKQED